METNKHHLFHSALRGVIASAGAETVFKVIGLLATAIILANLSPYEYGLWQLILSVLTAFSVLLFQNITGMFIADAAREIGAGRARTGYSIVVRGGLLLMVLGFVASAAMYLCAPLVAFASGLQITTPLQILALALVCSSLFQLYPLMLRVRLEFFHTQFTKILSRIAYLGGVLLFVAFFGWGIIGLSIAYLFSVAIPTLLYLPYVSSLYFSAWREIEGGWSDFFSPLIKRGKWVVASDGVSAVTGSFWPWFVGYFLSIETVGLISIAQTFLSQVSAFVPVSGVLRSVMPRTAEDPKRIAVWLARSMKYSLWMHLFGGVVALGIAYLLFPIIFPKYVAALPLCAILLLTFLFRPLSIVATEWFYSTHRQRDLFFYSSIPNLLVFMCMPAMLYLLGLPGYVLHAFLSSDIVLLGRLSAIRRFANIYIDWRELLRVDAQDREFVGRAISLVAERLGLRYTNSL